MKMTMKLKNKLILTFCIMSILPMVQNTIGLYFTHQQMKQMLNPANEDGYGKREMIQELKRVNAMLDSLKKEVAAQSQIDRQQRGEIALRQEVIQKQQVVSSIRASANSV
jgi:hypothetical protein